MANIKPTYVDDDSGQLRNQRTNDVVLTPLKTQELTSSELESATIISGETVYDTDEDRGVFGPLKRYLVGIRDTGKKINTVADLEGDTPSWFETLFSATPKRDMLGYNSVGDGGGGQLYWDADRDKQDHNAVTVFSPTHSGSTWGDTQDANWYSADGSDTGTGCWVRPDLGNSITVKQAGAIGDNTADDILAIQAAINWAYNNFDPLVAGGEVIFTNGTYNISKPILLPYGVTLSGVKGSKPSARVATISKNNSTESDLTASRSDVANTIIEDGFDGTDHTPNTIIHCVQDPTQEGSAFIGKISGLRLDGNGLCQYGIYGRTVSHSEIDNNFIKDCDYGAIFYESFFLGTIEKNNITNVDHGLVIDAGTSLDLNNNFVNHYAERAYAINGMYYSSIKTNAADHGAEGETTTYATAYTIRNCVGTVVENNGAETLNGIFLNARIGRGCSLNNNFCLNYEVTYTGGDTIAPIYLNFPACEITGNYISFVDPVAKQSNFWNLFVESFYANRNFLYKNNTITTNTGANNTTAGNDYFEEGFGQSTPLTDNYGEGVDVFPTDKTVFVRTAGDDTNDGEDATNALATIQAAFDKIPQPLNTVLTIDLGSETYSESLTVQNLRGNGRVIIEGDGQGSTVLDGEQSFEDCVDIEITGLQQTSDGTVQIHNDFIDTNAVVHDVDYNTAATGTLNQFVRTQGDSRVSVYGNTYTSTTGSNVIRAGDNSHIIIDANTDSSVASSFGQAGRISLAGKETSL